MLAVMVKYFIALFGMATPVGLENHARMVTIGKWLVLIYAVDFIIKVLRYSVQEHIDRLAKDD